ncbi:MAG: hypothetical protein U1F81_00775 [Verrucomicrobiaceae bacterium]
MLDLLPRNVLFSIESHIHQRVADAEYGFQFGEADEDTLTGALGQMLLTRPQDDWDMQNNRQFQWSFTYRKVRGRGPNAPEKTIGADGIFQIEVSDENGKMLRQKGLLFQAKIASKPGSSRKLRDQAELLSQFKRAAILIQYSRHGYSAVPIDQMVQENQTATRAKERILRPLADVLASDFLHCRIGQRELSYDPQRECLVGHGNLDGLSFDDEAHVVTVHIQQFPM